MARAAARTRDVMEALASMLPHLREDLQRRRTQKESWDLAHEDPGALGQEEDPLAEAKDTEDATSTRGPSELAAPLASETTASAAVSDADRKLWYESKTDQTLSVIWNQQHAGRVTVSLSRTVNLLGHLQHYLVVRRWSKRH